MLEKINSSRPYSCYYLTIALSALITFNTPSTSYAVEKCDGLSELVQELKKNFAVRFKNVTKNKNATTHAKLIVNNQLDKNAYMVKWKLKRENQTGPWAMKGNTLIHGIERGAGQEWIDKIGKKSFGLGFREVPWEVTDSQSAVLRIKDKLYSFGTIQDANSIESLNVKKYSNFFNETYTEATFMATPEELNAMTKFLEDRATNNIRAIKKIRSDLFGTVDEGTPIRPDFDITSTNLLQESCAGACSSMFHPDWLFHYNSPTALKLATMAVEKGLRNHSSANALVYSNFRNPNVSAITILGVDRSRDFRTSFIEDMSWGRVGGMMWGFIPDRPPKKPSPNYTTTRIPLKDWLQEND